MWLAIAMACGCNEIYGLDGTSLRHDARDVDGPGCSDGVFIGPEKLPDFDESKPEWQSNVRHDLREVWFQIDNSGWRIYSSRRASPSDPWGPMVVAPFIVVGDEYASLSGDGLRMMFLSNRTDQKAVYEVARASIEDPFPAQATPLTGLSEVSPGAIDLSFDGNTIYFTDNSELWEISRPAFDRPFANPRMIGAGIEYASVSPDGLEVFYNPTGGGNKLYRQTRASTLDMFGAPVLLRDVGEDPDLAGNGTTLYVSLTGGLAVMQRSCP